MPADPVTIQTAITNIDDNLYTAYVNAIAEDYKTATAAADAMGVDRLVVRRRLTGEVPVALADLVLLFGKMGKSKTIDGLIKKATEAARG